jgi:hypothetical protein
LRGARRVKVSVPSPVTSISTAAKSSASSTKRPNATAAIQGSGYLLTRPGGPSMQAWTVRLNRAALFAGGVTGWNATLHHSQSNCSTTAAPAGAALVSAARAAAGRSSVLPRRSGGAPCAPGPHDPWPTPRPGTARGGRWSAGPPSGRPRRSPRTRKNVRQHRDIEPRPELVTERGVPKGHRAGFFTSALVLHTRGFRRAR